MTISKLPPDYSIGNAAKELRNRAIVSASEQIEALICHDSSESGIEITLDWAMQIREFENLPWAQCIDAAMIFYYG